MVDLSLAFSRAGVWLVAMILSLSVSLPVFRVRASLVINRAMTDLSRVRLRTSKKPTNLFEKIFHAIRVVFEDSSQKWSETEFIFTLEKTPAA